MACFNAQVLLRKMLHLKSKNYSHSKRNLCQRKEKESQHVALHSAKRKLSSWVNLGRSEQTDRQAKLQGKKMHAQSCKPQLPADIARCAANSAKCLGYFAVI